MSEELKPDAYAGRMNGQWRFISDSESEIRNNLIGAGVERNEESGPVALYQCPAYQGQAKMIHLLPGKEPEIVGDPEHGPALSCRMSDKTLFDRIYGCMCEFSDGEWSVDEDAIFAICAEHEQRMNELTRNNVIMATRLQEYLEKVGK